jgi:hypothetical protein
MKTKILGILICMMLVTTFFTTTTIGTNFVLNKSKDNALETSPFEDDAAPTWQKNEKWTYSVDDFDIGDSSKGLFHFEIGDLPFTVVDDAGSSYELEFISDLDGNFEMVNATQEFDVRGELKRSTIEGNIFFRKSDLAIEEINIILSGKLLIKINKFPGLTFSFPRIPFRFKIDINIDFDRPFPIIDFPIDINKMWGLDATNITINGEITSPWLNIINSLNNVLNILPEDLADLLPIISIEELLDVVMGNSNIIYIPETPDVFFCTDMEMRTVPAGNYEAYNISFGGIMNYFYAPEMGHIIEMSLGMFNMKLIDHDIVIRNSFVYLQ